MSISPALRAYRMHVVRERFLTDGAKTTANFLGVHWATVYRMAKEMRLLCNGNQKKAERNTSCDIHYFDTWTPAMAYILGFMFADGSISSDLMAAKIEVTRSDECILQYIKEQTKSKLLIKHYTHKDSSTNPSSRLCLNSKILVKRLINLGMKPRKTFRDDVFPHSIPKEMTSHFIRGFFDGDGCVGISRRRVCSVNFIGTPWFVRGVRERLMEMAGMSWKKVKVEEGKEAKWGMISWTNPADLRSFRDFIYPDGIGFCLSRKRDRLCYWLDNPSRIEMKVWDENDNEVLIQHYEELGPHRVGKMIGRWGTVVRTHAKQLGLKYVPKFKRSVHNVSIAFG